MPFLSSLKADLKPIGTREAEIDSLAGYAYVVDEESRVPPFHCGRGVSEEL